MKRKLLLCTLMTYCAFSSAQAAQTNGLDLGPLTSLIGTWKSIDSGGIDVAPGQTQSAVGEGGVAIEPYYETITYQAVADATNASTQYLTALYYKQEVFRSRDNQKFHDQRGYLIYDKKKNMLYNSFCIPRAVCIVAQAKIDNSSKIINFESAPRGIAESGFMTQKDTTTKFTMSLDLSKKDILKYTQMTSLNVYGKAFSHSDSATLKRIQ
ncbi:putative signal peptide protein [Psychromonas sp. CNPT3]|uniref:heme-binding beta-barrel domain-containing protein n=1 Tax=Psychromonas sp. CNPT3 TaxID=314282 RepID=UPI00006E78B2|nr:heme-binding beta-barrel domain-containing protein [Psychromonas sp. CNPT3]AGH82068.1 putative signal peptide protein [Psychromonas sp. CNPT3]